MYSYRLVFGVAAFLAAGPVWAQSAGPATLNELLTRALQNNRDLLAVRQRIDEAKGLLRQAGVRPAPTLDVLGANGRALGTLGEAQLFAGISLEIETAGKRPRRVQVAEKQLALAEAEYDEGVRQLRYAISVRYAEYASDSERLPVIDRLIQANQQSLDLTRARVEKGDAAVLEQNLLAVELSRLEAQHAATTGRVESARADVSRLVGLGAGEGWTVSTSTDRLPLLDKAELVMRALDQRPDLRMLRAAEQQGDAETALAEAEARPNPKVIGGYSHVTARFDDQFGFTPSGQPIQLQDSDNILNFGVSIPLFSRKRNLGNIEASIARTRAAQLRKKYLERAIPLEVEAAWQRLESSRRALTSLNTGARTLAERNLEVIRQAYQLGQLRLLDVLNEQRRVVDTHLASIDAQAELRRGVAELEKAIGGSIQ